VFDPLTRGITTLLEAAEFMLAGKHKVVIATAFLSIGQEIEGQTLTVEEAMDINGARAELFEVAKAWGAKVFEDIPSSVRACVRLVQGAEKDFEVLNA
jgi:hypothetical protein